MRAAQDRAVQKTRHGEVRAVERPARDLVGPVMADWACPDNRNC